MTEGEHVGFADGAKLGSAVGWSLVGWAVGVVEGL
jgi:hypothetical protein